MAINLAVALYTYVTEISSNTNFNVWFKRCSILSSMITLLSAADLGVFGLLKSKLFGWELFNAPFSERAKTILYYGSFMSIVKDLIQLSIQIYYYRITVIHDVITVLSLGTSALSIFFKIILKIYEEIDRRRGVRQE